MTNLLIIMTDNQGAWTLGCHGNDEIHTPHIDGLAAEGLRCERAYAVNSVCSPSRATFFTGLLPSQHGVHCYLGGERPDAQMGPEAYDTLAEFVTLPRLLAEAGWRCGLAGKWHLGDSLRPQQGFDYWFTKPKGHTSTFYDADMIWQGRVYPEPRYATEAITAHALDFLGQAAPAAAAGERPFCLYVGYNGPYGLGEHMTSTHVNAHTERYAEAPLTCFPRESVHPWLRQNREFIGNPVSLRGYAAAVSGVDDGVGELQAALEGHGVAEDTLVLFTADQGLCGGHHGMWGMGDHSRPIHAFEEALHIPLILRHPGRIPAGTTFGGRTCNYDVFPTLVDYLGLEAPTPPDHPQRPGRSWAAALRCEPAAWDDEETFYEFESVRTVRTARWKYTRRQADGPDELYDMEADPGERWNLVHDPAQAGVVADHAARLEAFFTRYAEPRWDLWRAGGSKAGRLTAT